MKKRLGFVSNSSSSSFIIAYKGESDVCECCGRSGIDIVKYLDEGIRISEDDEIEFFGEEEVVNGVKEKINSGWVGEDHVLELKELILMIEKKSKEKYQIAQVSVSYRNEFLNNEINNSKSIEVLYKEER